MKHTYSPKSKLKNNPTSRYNKHLFEAFQKKYQKNLLNKYFRNWNRKLGIVLIQEIEVCKSLSQSNSPIKLTDLHDTLSQSEELLISLMNPNISQLNTSSKCCSSAQLKQTKTMEFEVFMSSQHQIISLDDYSISSINDSNSPQTGVTEISPKTLLDQKEHIKNQIESHISNSIINQRAHKNFIPSDESFTEEKELSGSKENDFVEKSKERLNKQKHKEIKTSENRVSQSTLNNNNNEFNVISNNDENKNFPKSSIDKIYSKLLHIRMIHENYTDSSEAIQYLLESDKT